jgi:hypothetical protein
MYLLKYYEKIPNLWFEKRIAFVGIANPTVWRIYTNSFKFTDKPWYLEQRTSDIHLLYSVYNIISILLLW